MPTEAASGRVYVTAGTTAVSDAITPRSHQGASANVCNKEKKKLKCQSPSILRAASSVQSQLSATTKNKNVRALIYSVYKATVQ